MTILDDRMSGARIGILDDEVYNCRLLERFLGRDGFRVVRTWTDPDAALAALAGDPVDLLLLDLLMPRIDGYEVIVRLGEMMPTVGRAPIVVLTADTTRDARDRALGLGAADFLTKPFDPKEVSLRIRNILTQHFLEIDLLAEKGSLESQVRDRTAELRESSARREALFQRLVTAQEEERRRVAADIHDDTIQTLAALGIRLELARRQADTDDLARELDLAIATVHAATRGLREMLFQLHPAILDRDGLEAALRADAERAAAGSGDDPAPAVGLSVTLDAEPAHETRVTIYRIAQEALRNARRHAGASHVRIEVRSDDGGIRLVVADDGRGFDTALARRPRTGHLGLSAMRERAELAGGTWTVESSPGAGATIEAWIPIGYERPGIPPDLLAHIAPPADASTAAAPSADAERSVPADRPGGSA